MSLKRVILIGAGGNLGSIILRSFIDSEALEVTILTRSTSKSAFPPDVQVIKTEYTEDKLVLAFQGQDAVVSAVGAAGLLEQKVFIDAAIKAGVKRFIPSEFSINTLSAAAQELVPVFGLKAQVLEYLKTKESTGLSWTGLAGGLLFDWGLHSGFLGFDLTNRRATIWDSGNSPFSVTNQADLGGAVVSILTHPAETANKYLYVATVTTTQKTILDSLEAQTGEKWAVDHVKTEEQIAQGRKLVSEGDMSGMFMLVQASGYGAYAGLRANYAAEETLANSILEVPEGSVEETVRRVVEATASR